MSNLIHKGRTIGRLDGKHLIKTGKQVQLYRMFDGFGISKDVLDLINDVTLHYENKVYKATSEEFWRNGINHDFNGDKQLILPRRFWSFKDKDQLSLI